MKLSPTTDTTPCTPGIGRTMFSTWGAKAIALIGKLPDTLADRSITIEMRRKMPSERVHKLRGDVERRYLEEVSRRSQRFAIDAFGPPGVFLFLLGRGFLF